MTARNKGLESLGMTGEVRADPLTTSRKRSRNPESQGDEMFKKISQESRFTFNHPELQTSPRLISEQQPEVLIDAMDNRLFSQTIKNKLDPRIAALSADPSAVSLEVRGTAILDYNT